MTAYVIPVIGIQDYQQRVDLDGEVYVLRFRWNSRATAYFFDLMDDQENPIVMGRRCVVDTILAPLPFRDARPPGALVLFDTTLNRKDPAAPEEFGTRVVLIYMDAAEVAAL